MTDSPFPTSWNTSQLSNLEIVLSEVSTALDMIKSLKEDLARGKEKDGPCPLSVPSDRGRRMTMSLVKDRLNHIDTRLATVLADGYKKEKEELEGQKPKQKPTSWPWQPWPWGSDDRVLKEYSAANLDWYKNELWSIDGGWRFDLRGQEELIESLQRDFNSLFPGGTVDTVAKAKEAIFTRLMLKYYVGTFLGKNEKIIALFDSSAVIETIRCLKGPVIISSDLFYAFSPDLPGFRKEQGNNASFRCVYGYLDESTVFYYPEAVSPGLFVIAADGTVIRFDNDASSKRCARD